MGQSWDIYYRKKRYSKMVCKTQRKLYHSIRKYGWDEHIFKIIHYLPSDVEQNVMNNYEVFYWEAYKSLGFNMLNLQEPGKNGRHSLETRILMSHKQKENHRNPNRKNNYTKVPISQFALNGKFIKNWNSRKEAAESLGITPGAIGHALSGRKEHCSGFVWKYTGK